MKKGLFIAAAAQMTAVGDLQQNLQICEDLAAQAQREGVSLLVLPECFAFLGEREGDRLSIAEELDLAKTDHEPGPILETLQRLAREHSMWIIGGGMAEVVRGDSARSYNTLVVLSPAGELLARYRKLHLFDVDIPGKATLRESDSTAAGEDILAVSTDDVGTLGLSICYDLRFPELYRELTRNHGAQVLLVPAAFTAHTGSYHWHTLLRARAIENQCFVIAAAQAGRHNAKRESYGHALIVDPWGDIIAELPSGTGLATATIDLERVADVRSKMPCLEHAKL